MGVFGCSWVEIGVFSASSGTAKFSLSAPEGMCELSSLQASVRQVTGCVRNHGKVRYCCGVVSEKNCVSTLARVVKGESVLAQAAAI